MESVMGTPFDLSSLIESHRLQDPQAWQELAQKCIGQNRRDFAESCFQRITELNPTLVEGWANLAALVRARGAFETAAEYYQRAAELEPANVPLVSALIHTLREARMHVQALPWCEKILQADINSAGTQLLAGNLYQELEQFDKAMALLT
jgi:tetratricopeptide (TPR) repeat protein